MQSGWRSVRLSEIAAFSNGQKRPSRRGEIPVYGGNGIMAYADRWNAEGETVVIGRVGAYCGNVHYERGRCWISDNAIAAKPAEGHSGKFLYYRLKSLNLHDLRIGSSQPLLTQSIVKELAAEVPASYAEQEGIASLLTALDAAIATNEAIVGALEETARSIFRRWFVEYEFPDERGEPYASSGGPFADSGLGRIPAGWTVRTVGEVASVVRGASPRPIRHYLDADGDGMPWVKISDATESRSKFIVRTKARIKAEGVAKSRIVRPGTLILSNSATPGLPKFVLIDACVHDGWLVFDGFKGVTKAYMYHFLSREREGIVSLSNGSVFRNLKTDILKQYKLVVPDAEVMRRADGLFRAADAAIAERERQNESLRRIRDELLPRLMSGAIRVPAGLSAVVRSAAGHPAVH